MKSFTLLLASAEILAKTIFTVSKCEFPVESVGRPLEGIETEMSLS